ncbi:hypothetical protein HYU94_02960 [Candidatus Daviesbacteria bacterium]|nr:hypothetical protein [Candidatus Daviesbacteria bacterium]
MNTSSKLSASQKGSALIWLLFAVIALILLSPIPSYKNFPKCVTSSVPPVVGCYAKEWFLEKPLIYQLVLRPPKPMPSPTSDINPKGREFQNNDNYFVNFAQVDGEILLSYKGKIYSQEYDPQTGNTRVVDLKDPKQYQWEKLVESPIKSPVEQFIADELFDFKIFPNKKDFVFIMRWRPMGSTANSFENKNFNVFYYDHLIKKVIGPLELILKDGTEYNGVPKVDQISNDGKSMSFNMYVCWNCGGDFPQKLVFNITNKQAMNIGKVAYFKWKDNGMYEYKDYIGITCPIPTPGGPREYLQSACFEEPKNLPLKSGQF